MACLARPVPSNELLGLFALRLGRVDDSHLAVGLLEASTDHTIGGRDCSLSSTYAASEQRKSGAASKKHFAFLGPQSDGPTLAAIRHCDLLLVGDENGGR
jgi:hypothetical protein